MTETSRRDGKIIKLLAPGDRVEHAECSGAGTVAGDDGVNVTVRWDNGKTGNLAYDRSVAFNAYKLIKNCRRD